MKMNPEVKALWCDALESGEFEQVRGNLRDHGSGGGYGYCCLGVLSEVYRRHTGNGEWCGSAFLADPKRLNARSYATALPPQEVAKWAFNSLQTRNPIVIIGGVETFVAEHNDMCWAGGPPRTFKEIAKAVREQL